MDKKANRRKSERFSAKWNAAVVFNKPDNKPVLCTQTEDISQDGTAICSEYPDIAGAEITLLLAPPARSKDGSSKPVKIRARVVSAVRMLNKSLYRHGVRFLSTPDNGLDILSELRKSAVEANAGAAIPEAGAPVMSRLAQLKALAQAKAAGDHRSDPGEERDLRVSDMLNRVHVHLKDLATQLDILKPVFTRRNYAIAGVPEFADLVWADARVFYNTKEVGLDRKLLTSVSLHYRLSGKRQLQITRDYPANQRLKRTLTENGIEFNEHDVKTETGAIAGSTFIFPCEVTAGLVFAARLADGEISVKMRNVERFGDTEVILGLDQFDDGALDELTRFILGETSRIGWLR